MKTFFLTLLIGLMPSLAFATGGSGGSSTPKVSASSAGTAPALSGHDNYVLTEHPVGTAAWQSVSVLSPTPTLDQVLTAGLTLTADYDIKLHAGSATAWRFVDGSSNPILTLNSSTKVVTFAVAPVMSGASITNATIPSSAMVNTAVANLTNTNSGDITLTAVGASPSANGATLSGQALTLQLFDGTHPGLVGGTSTAQTLAPALTLSNPLTLSSTFNISMTEGISAAGTTQGNCTALTKTYNNVTTVGAGQGVCLMTGVDGAVQWVKNATTTQLKVYPASGQAIDGPNTTNAEERINGHSTNATGGTIKFTWDATAALWHQERVLDSDNAHNAIEDTPITFTQDLTFTGSPQLVWSNGTGRIQIPNSSSLTVKDASSNVLFIVDGSNSVVNARKDMKVGTDATSNTTAVTTSNVIGPVFLTGGTNDQAADFIIKSSNSKGTGVSRIRLQVPTAQGSTSNTLNAPSTDALILAYNAATLSAPLTIAASTGLTAGTTQTLAGATACPNDVCVYSTVANANDGGKLATPAAGTRQTVVNLDATHTMKLYPSAAGNNILCDVPSASISGCTLGTFAGAGVAITLLAQTSVICTGISSTQYVCE